MHRGQTLAWLVSGLTADTAKILFDQPGAAYDQVHAALERAAPLPTGLRGRVWFVAVVLLVKNLVGGSGTQAGPLRRFFTEVADDTVVETLKRVIEHAGIVPVMARSDRKPLARPMRSPASDGASRIDALTRTIAPWMG